MPFMAMQHDEDPAKVILDKVGMKKLGLLPGFEILGNEVLLGIYERPEKTKSNVYLPDSVRKEDEHQGKAGLVLAKGPAAFVSDDNYDFKDQSAEPGEWVAAWVSDGRKIVVNGQLCRLVRDQDIRLKIPSPDSVF